SDLGNHNPSPGIFSSSSYDDEFETALNNVASSVEVSLKEMQHFKFQNVWVLVDLPACKYAIGTKWILKNKGDARGIVVRNKARLVAQGHKQEEGIDYDEVFAPIARIEAIRLFLAFASYMGFLVYQMDVRVRFSMEELMRKSMLLNLKVLWILNILRRSTSLPVPTGSILVPVVATMVPIDDVPVHSSSSNDLIFDGEPTTRFPCPSDLGNHNPSPGIFSSSSYDDEFETALNNVASSVEVSLKEMQHFKFQNVWVLVDLPACKYAIGTKWILKNKGDARGIVVRNKARLVAQGHKQEEGIDYDEVFAPIARIEAIRLFLAFASYMGFLVYQMDVRVRFSMEELMRKSMLLNLKVLWILNILRRSTR
nr:putative ribonuclease H-like domain-containing protein [Tanacetum cinerariifolium]